MNECACGRSTRARTGRCLALLCMALLVLPAGNAGAQTYPARPVRLIVPYAPGGGTEILARALAPRVSDALGQSLEIENRGGAGGNIGADTVAKSQPDGYTLLMAANTIAINAGLQKLPFDPVKDFAPVTMLATAPLLLAVHPGVNAKSVAELIALAKANPGKLNFSNPGNGTPQRLGEIHRNDIAKYGKLIRDAGIRGEP